MPSTQQARRTCWLICLSTCIVGEIKVMRLVTASLTHQNLAYCPLCTKMIPFLPSSELLHLIFGAQLSPFCISHSEVRQIQERDAQAASSQQIAEGGVTELLSTASTKNFSLNEKQVCDHCRAPLQHHPKILFSENTLSISEIHSYNYTHKWTSCEDEVLAIGNRCL